MPRKQNRTSVSINVVLEWASGKREARISDISLGGCFVDSMTPISQGEIVSFEIEVGEGHWLRFDGRAAYVFPGIGFGVHFLPMPEEVRGALEHLILMNGGNPWAGD